jgi:hypothetical protein
MNPAPHRLPLEVLRAARGELSRFVHQIPPQILDELAQEAVLRLWCAQGVHEPCAFVRTVARRLAISHLRRAREIPSAELPERVTSEDHLEDAIDAGRARALLEGAPEPYRRVLEALVLEERTVDELVRGEDGAARRRARDLVYKHRARGLSWLSQALGRHQPSSTHARFGASASTCPRRTSRS